MIPGTERPIHTVINHIMPPKGPAGRHGPAGHIGIGIWKWSKVQELAKEFFEWHFEKEQQEKFLTASHGYNQPFLKAFSMHPHLRLQSQVLLRAIHVKLCSRDRLARHPDRGGPGGGGSVHHPGCRGGTRDGPHDGGAGSEKSGGADQENLPTVRQEGITETVKRQRIGRRRYSDALSYGACVVPSRASI